MRGPQRPHHHLVHVRPSRALLGQDDALPAQHERRRNQVPLQAVRQSQAQLEAEVNTGPGRFQSILSAVAGPDVLLVRKWLKPMSTGYIYNCSAAHVVDGVCVWCRCLASFFRSAPYLHSWCYLRQESDEDVPGHVESSMQDPLLLHGALRSIQGPSIASTASYITFVLV